MDTANGANFNTQSYRHGVRVGNWNEDQYGCDLLAASQASAAAFPATLAATPNGARLFATPLTTTHTSYTDHAAHALVRDAAHADKAQARMAPDVAAPLLFAHRGADPMDKRYQSSYRAAFTAGTGYSQPPPVDRTIQKLRESNPANLDHLAATAHENESRSRSYRTAASDAFSPASSVAALPVDAQGQIQGAGRSTRQDAVLSPITGLPVPFARGQPGQTAAVRTGDCGAVLEKNYLKLHLRQ